MYVTNCLFLMLMYFYFSSIEIKFFKTCVSSKTNQSFKFPGEQDPQLLCLPPIRDARRLPRVRRTCPQPAFAEPEQLQLAGQHCAEPCAGTQPKPVRAES